MFRPWLACLFAVSAMYGQEGRDSAVVRQLDEVVVTDTRFPLKREQSGKTVIRLEREDLRRYSGQSLAQVLNQLSGFEVSGSRGRPGEILGVFARGGRGRQVLVLVDGLRVSDPTSAAREYDLRLLPLSAIESVEIVKGAASVLYGANAATAVIDIRTRKAGQAPLSLTLEGSAGTQNTAGESDPDLGQFQQHAQLSGRQGRWSFTGEFSHARADGLSSLEAGTEPDPYSSWSADLKLGRDLSEHSRLGVFANKSRMRSAYDDSFNGVDAPFEFRTDQERLGLQWAWKDSIQQLDLLGAYTEYQSENISDFPGRFDGTNWTADLTYRRRLGAGLYGLLGLNIFRDRAELESPESFTVADPYLNLVWTHRSGVNLNAGLRLNTHSTYGNQGIYQVNPSYVYGFRTGYLKLMGSWATAYITPSLAQLYGSFGANPDLEAESNRTVEAGLEFSLVSGLRFTLLHFDRKEENTVLFDNAGFLYFNSDSGVRVRGLEGELHWEWSAGSRLQLNYTFTEPEGENAIRIPKHKLNLLTRWQVTRKGGVSVRYSFTGERTDTDFSTFTPVVLEGFSLVDLRLDYEFCPGRLSAFLQLSNALNETYTEVLGFTTPGRNLMMGWNLQL